MGGSSQANQPGVYGTLGVPGASNVPGGRTGAATWVDGSGNHWIFGGIGCATGGTIGYLNDLWELSASSGEWTWMGGSYVLGQPGNYGTLGVPAAGNIPGGREGAATWIDTSGNLWLFGGYGSYAAGTTGDMNDLWEFSPTTLQWTWMGGGMTPVQAGTLGVADPSNIPETRDMAVSWTDASGNFWLLGGEDAVSSQQGSTAGLMNDLWEYDAATSEWTWMGGSTSQSMGGVYGTEGSLSASNYPGSRSGANLWTDSSGNQWLFGGQGLDASWKQGYLDDLWVLNSSAQQWGWMAGNENEGGYSMNNGVSTLYGSAGTYGTLGQAAQANVPGGRAAGAHWIDASGNLWMLGGQGFDSTGQFGFLNDLWQFNPGAGEFTWMGGSKSVGSYGTEPGVYGALGVPAAGNTPGGRYGAVSWTDANGTLWLFGGVGASSTGTAVFNDLWEYWTSMPAPAATPTFSVPPGSYASPVTVTLADATTGATIYYTTNGTTPTTSSTVYSGPITVSSSETLEAIAIASGYAQSAVASAAYTIAPPVAATPAFSAPSGNYAPPFSVTISDATNGATIYYTTNGTTPTTGSFVYNGPITVSSSVTLEAIAIASGYTQSAVASAAYTITSPAAATPTFSSPSGTYAPPFSVTISDATSGATIYYTTNGTTPTTSSSVYNGPIRVGSSETLEAIAIAPGYTRSAVASATYTIAPAAATPVFGPPGGTYTSPVMVIISDTTKGAVIHYTTNGTTPTASSPVYTSPISVSSSERVQAIAIAAGYSQSAVASATYTIN
jgi:N-acetylneuraminic acid mutarotase